MDTQAAQLAHTLAQSGPHPDFALFINFLGNNALWIMIFAIVFVSIVFGSLTKIFHVRARERSRREIAAYIAEGSMSPEQGERLMRAGAVSSEA